MDAAGLVGFVRARLDADEWAAREAQPGPWHIGGAVDPTELCNVHTFPASRGVADGLRWLDAEHIIRHNPARVLRDVEADRLILAAHAEHPVEPNFCRTCGSTVGPCTTKRLLALRFADHPDYNEGWRP